MIYSLFICELLQHKSPKLTKGEQYWYYAYVIDMANSMLSLAENANVVSVFNVGFEDSNQIMNMQANISKLYQ